MDGDGEVNVFFFGCILLHGNCGFHSLPLSLYIHIYIFINNYESSIISSLSLKARAGDLDHQSDVRQRPVGTAMKVAEFLGIASPKNVVRLAPNCAQSYTSTFWDFQRGESTNQRQC